MLNTRGNLHSIQYTHCSQYTHRTAKHPTSARTSVTYLSSFLRLPSPLPLEHRSAKSQPQPGSPIYHVQHRLGQVQVRRKGKAECVRACACVYTHSPFLKAPAPKVTQRAHNTRMRAHRHAHVCFHFVCTHVVPSAPHLTFLLTGQAMPGTHQHATQQEGHWGECAKTC